MSDRATVSIRFPMMKRPARGACLLVLCALLVSCGGRSDDPLAPYKNQKLQWQPCGQPFRAVMNDYFLGELDKLGGRAGCAFMLAPLDYTDPSRGDVQVALLRVSAEDPSRRLGAILFNPGGPGGDGLYLSIAFGAQWAAADAGDPVGDLYKQMSRRYDLVGFSPRGVGASTNLICPSDESFRYEAPIIVDDSQENWDRILYNARLIAESCRKNPRTPYMNSETTARDMDLVRHLLGDDRLNYIGISYGTWLGTWYAGLFPERVGRMLLIGNTDITVPLNNVLIEQPRADQRVLDEVLIPYAVRHADRFNLGGTPEEVRQAYLSLRTAPGYLLSATLDVLPIADSSRAGATLQYLKAAQGMQGFIRDNPQADEAAVKAWIRTALFIPDHQDLNQQTREKAHVLNGIYLSKARHETKKAFLQGEGALQWAVSCNDAGSGFDVDGWVGANRADVGPYPLFAGLFARNACLYWGPPTVKRPPVAAIAGAGNILMLQSEMDPWTPLEGANRTFEILPNASMILVRDEYTHALHVPYGAACIDQPIAEYFLYGKQPQRLTTCAGTPLAEDR